MKSDLDDSVRMRKWTQDFDEIAGRSTPPDRVEEILWRAAFDRIEDEPVRASVWRQLRPAALVLLGIAAIFGVVQLREQAAIDESATVAAMQDPEQPKQDPIKVKRPIDDPTTETAKAEREQLERVSAELRARVEAAVAAKKLEELLDPASQNPIAVAKQKELAEQLVVVEQREQQIARLLATVRQRVDAQAAPPNPLIKGDYRKALDKLTAERGRLDACADAAAARKIIDDMSRTLEQARLALWKLEKAGTGALK